MLPFLTWLIQGAVGPALVGLPVAWTSTEVAGAAGRWFKRLRRSDGLSRIVRAAAGDGIELSDREFTAIRRLLEQEGTWVLAGRGTVEDVAVRIASCLLDQPAGDVMAAGRAIAAGLLEFAVCDLEPDWFRQVLFARLDRLETEHANAVDSVMLSLHADLAAQLACKEEADGSRFARMMDHLGLVLNRLPPGPADDAEVAVYLAALIRSLNTDPWPQDIRLGGPTLSPAAIERKLRMTSGSGLVGQDLDADELARQCSRLVVLGGPGSGKTWFARRAARLCAEAALDALAAGARVNEVELPLYTTCARLLAAPLHIGIRRALVSSALGQLPDMGGERVLDALRMLFEERNGPTLLVTDSLDEASGAGERIRQADTLPAAWRIVLTSRSGSWNEQLAIKDRAPSRRSGYLRPLLYPDDVEPLITAWFTGKPGQAASVVTQLRDHPALQTAATVPLILAFYCVIGGDQPLPGRRADLYAKVITRMLTGLWRSKSDRYPDPKACLEILRDWAWSAAASNPVSGVGEWADEFPTPQVNRSQEDQDALDHVAVPLGPPDPDTGMTRRRFVHRSIQEHLVAEHVAFRASAEEAAAELVNHLWYDRDWEYSLPAAVASHPDREALLRALLRRAAPDNANPLDVTGTDQSHELREVLARIAENSAETDWSAEMAAVIGQARVDLAAAQPRRAHALPDWPASDQRARERLLALLADGPRDAANIALIAEAVAGLAATEAERTLVSDLLSTQLTDVLDSQRATRGQIEDLGQAVARLALAGPQWAPARGRLLALLISQTGAWKAAALAGPVSELHPAQHERDQARDKLLTLLAAEKYPGAHGELIDGIAKLSPTQRERAQVRDTLLALLADEQAPSKVTMMAEALARFDATEPQRAQALDKLLSLVRKTDELEAQALALVLPKLGATEPQRNLARDRLLTLLANAEDPSTATTMSEALAGLVPTEPERIRALDKLLTLLADEIGPSADETGLGKARILAGAVARLAPTERERVQVRGGLLALLAEQTKASKTVLVSNAMARLVPTEPERVQVLDKLLALLADETDAREAAALAEVMIRYKLTNAQRVQVLDKLLALLADEARSWAALEIAKAVTGLDPTDTQQAQVRDKLLALLANEYRIEGDAAELAGAIAVLDPTEAERSLARDELFTLLSIACNTVADVHTIRGQTGWVAADMLIHAVVALAPTEPEQGQVRDELLALLAQEPHSGLDWLFGGILNQLSVTAGDLAKWPSWAFPSDNAPLASARQNSPLPAWLAILPTLHVPPV